MRGRAVIPLVVGLGVGLLALKVFVNVLQKAKGAPSATVSVVYSTANIEPTLEIQESMIEIRQVSKETVPDTCFRDKAEVVGRVASWPIPKGCPIGEMQLAARGTPPGMAVRITNGYRAVAVKIDESAGVAGWVKPGSRVDVVALLTNPDRGVNRSISKVILQNVEVLAVGQDIGKPNDTAAAVTNTVTLLVTPADVPKLHLAETKGKLRLAMRNQRDEAIGQESTTTDNELAAQEISPQPAAPSPANRLLEAFLSAQAKMGRSQTDKETGSEAEAEQPAHTGAAAQAWTVEVIRGQDAMDQVKFEGKDGAWHCVEVQQARSSRPSASASARPVPLVPPRGGAPAAATATN
ncbi:MAG: Flp pilus assembly protein CpaB [Planctomycetes bacterium]|nr:Flp pilus assembly protein CpaB [Planctomycetota bacterium]